MTKSKGKMFKVIHPDFNMFESEILTCVETFQASGKDVLVGKRNQIKKFEMGNHQINIKSFKSPNAFNALVYKYIRPSKAKRSYDYANKLMSLGISTPQPIAFIEYAPLRGLNSSYYISKHIDYDLDFRVLIHKQSLPNRVKILQEFTEFTFRLHENNINFLDHSPGNTIIKKDDNRYNFYLIDLNRMRFETMDFNKRMHNFRRLWLSKTMIRIMAKTYAELYGKTYEETHRLMLEHSLKFQRKSNQKKMKKLGRRPKFKSD